MPPRSFLHICARFFTRIGQSGHAPGFSRAVKQLFQAMRSHSCYMAGMGNSWQCMAIQPAMPKVLDDLPVCHAKGADSIKLGDSLGDFLIPLAGVGEKTRRVKMQMRFT